MYEELDLFGVYLAPFVAMMLVAWVVTQPLNAISNRFSLPCRIWHPGLFNICVYLVVLAATVLFWRPF